MTSPWLLAARVPRVVLASASPTRAHLLRAAGVPFEQQPAAIDEPSLKEALQSEGVPAGDAAVALAELKAERVAARMPDAIVLGADQILTCEGRWFDKPRHRAEASAQLDALQESGMSSPPRWSRCAAARASGIMSPCRASGCAPCSPSFREAYLDAVGEAALTSVGAYQIEGVGAQLLARIEGDHFAVLGLPLLELLEFLRAQGVLLR